MRNVASKHSETARAVLTHVMVDMYGVDSETLDDADRMGEILSQAATQAGLHPLAEPAVYRYPGRGLTVFLPIRESHFAIHTYPEHGFASADIVSCGPPEQAKRARDFIVEHTAAQDVDTKVVFRGFLEDREFSVG